MDEQAIRSAFYPLQKLEKRSGRNTGWSAERPSMDAALREMEDLELALLRRGVDELSAERERCTECHRTPLDRGARVQLQLRRDAVRAVQEGMARGAGAVARRPRSRVRSHDAAHRSARRGLTGATSRPAIESRPWNRSRSRRRSPSRASRCSSTWRTSPTTPSSTITSWSTGTSCAQDSYGTGAGVRFRAKAPLNRFSWADMSIAEMQPPHRIVERGRGGKYNRIRMLSTYTLSPGPERVDEGRVHARDRARDALRQAAGIVRRTSLDEAAGDQGDATTADDSRGGS